MGIEGAMTSGTYADGATGTPDAGIRRAAASALAASALAAEIEDELRVAPDVQLTWKKAF